MGGSELASRHCVPCRGGTPLLTGEALEKFKWELPDWRVVEDHHIEKAFLFPGFKTGLDFVNRIGTLAESEGHHPDLCLAWGRVQAIIYTHKINGLSESDFVLAAKIDELFFGRT